MKKNIALLAVTAALAACGKADDKPKVEEIRPVRVLTIAESSTERSVEYAAEIRARHEVRLAFRVPGKIARRLVEVGSRVRAGQPLAELDPADLALAEAGAKAQVAALETDRNLAQADLKRYRELRERNFISQAEFDRRASALEAAESRLAAAQASLRQSTNQAGYAALAADADGVITAIEAEAGQVVAAGQPVVRLARTGELEASFAVPEVQVDAARRASGYTVTLNARPGKSWPAKLRELSPSADPLTRTYAARATIAGAGSDLELGMSARVAVRLPATTGARIEVPLAAVVSRGSTPQVFLVDAQGIVKPQDVTTAGMAGERVAIATGLKPGDVIVAAGASLLTPGQRVKVLAEGK